MTKDILKRNSVKIKGNINSADTIIFAHGFGSDQSAWKQITPFFEQHYRLVLFDHVGAGNAEAAAYSAFRYSSIEEITSAWCCFFGR